MCAEDVRSGVQGAPAAKGCGDQQVPRTHVAQHLGASQFTVHKPAVEQFQSKFSQGRDVYIPIIIQLPKAPACRRRPSAAQCHQMIACSALATPLVTLFTRSRDKKIEAHAS